MFLQGSAAAAPPLPPPVTRLAPSRLFPADDARVTARCRSLSPGPGSALLASAPLRLLACFFDPTSLLAASACKAAAATAADFAGCQIHSPVPKPAWQDRNECSRFPRCCCSTGFVCCSGCGGAATCDCDTTLAAAPSAPPWDTRKECNAGGDRSPCGCCTCGG